MQGRVSLSKEETEAAVRDYVLSRNHASIKVDKIKLSADGASANIEYVKPKHRCACIIPCLEEDDDC